MSDILKEVQEFLEDMHIVDVHETIRRSQELHSKVQAARQAPASGEPVAYMFSDECGRTKIVLGKETAEHWCPPDETVTSLFAHPPAKVPAEPTEEMLEAAMSERDKQHPANAKRYLRYVWEKMLSAMPTPAATPQPPVEQEGK